jgi:hypothetical protein
MRGRRWLMAGLCACALGACDRKGSAGKAAARQARSPHREAYRHKEDPAVAAESRRLAALAREERRRK